MCIRDSLRTVADVQRPRGADDMAVANGTDVVGVDLHAHAAPAGDGAEIARGTAEGLGQQHRRAAVQQLSLIHI